MSPAHSALVLTTNYHPSMTGKPIARKNWAYLFFVDNACRSDTLYLCTERK